MWNHRHRGQLWDLRIDGFWHLWWVRESSPRRYGGMTVITGTGNWITDEGPQDSPLEVGAHVEKAM